MKIGFVGLGAMGAAMVERLYSQGFDVLGWNRTSRLWPEHWTLTTDLADLSARSDVIITMVLDDAATVEVFTSLLADGARGKVFIVSSTLAADTVKHLHTMTEQAGATLIDAPVAGTVAPARQGQLLSLVGGAEGLRPQLEPILSAYSRRLVFCGPPGAGMAMKHFVNTLLSVYFGGLAEALGTGSAAGLPLDLMMDVLLDTPAGLPAAKAKLPVILGQTGPVAFSVNGACKDINVLRQSSKSLGIPTTMLDGALAVFEAARAAGYGDDDLAVVARCYLKPER